MMETGKKKILLIGDSIRGGYDDYVKEVLAPVAEVLYPEDSARFAQYTQRYLGDWVNTMRLDGASVDVVHWNTGLWDVLRLYGDEPETPIAAYTAYIGRIQKRISILFPRAVSVFAYTTPVRAPEYWEHPDSFMRYNEDIRAYNAAARAILEPMGVRFNDLYALLADAPDSYHSDNTHYYTPEGTAYIGNAVVSKILDALGMEESVLKA